MSFRIAVTVRLPVLLAAVIPSPMWGQPVPARKLVDSDSVIVAEVISGRQTGKVATCVLLVSRTIKGSLLPNDRVNVSWNTWLGFDRNLAGNYGIWHLNQLPSGGWLLRQVDRDKPYVPLQKGVSPVGVTVPTGMPALPQPVTVGDRMAAELVAALQVHTNLSDVGDLASLFLALDRTRFVTALYSVLRASPDPELKFIGLSGMLMLNDIAALDEISKNVEEISKVKARHWVLSGIMARRDLSPIAIQALGRIASSSDLDAQFAAAVSLQLLHTRDTLPVLVQLLDSPRQITRETAIRGLSSFVDNLPPETPHNVVNGTASIPQGATPYRTVDTDRYSLSRRLLGKENDTEYVQFWKSWWVKTRADLIRP